MRHWNSLLDSLFRPQFQYIMWHAVIKHFINTHAEQKKIMRPNEFARAFFVSSAVQFKKSSSLNQKCMCVIIICTQINELFAHAVWNAWRSKFRSLFSRTPLQFASISWFKSQFIKLVYFINQFNKNLYRFDGFSHAFISYVFGLEFGKFKSSLNELIITKMTMVVFGFKIWSIFFPLLNWLWRLNSHIKTFWNFWSHTLPKRSKSKPKIKS